MLLILFNEKRIKISMLEIIKKNAQIIKVFIHTKVKFPAITQTMKGNFFYVSTKPHNAVVVVSVCTLEYSLKFVIFIV